MDNSNTWDWDVGRKEIADVGKWNETFEWAEEPYASPDGEKVAAVVKTGEMEFSVCENGTAWENTFDKVWHLRFSPDNRLAGVVSDMGEWTVAVDGEVWENTFEFVWAPCFSADGKSIAVAAQKGRKYFGVLNDVPWEEGFHFLTNLTQSSNGARTAAAVQTIPVNEGDIFKFQQGCFSVAVDGVVWDKNFLNVWRTTFSPDVAHVAAEVRLNLYDYTIVIDGVPWKEVFSSVWEPKFNPIDGSVTAPVKLKNGWTIARDGNPMWGGRFIQLWHHIYSPDCKKMAAIVAPKYGRWTVAVDSEPWQITYGDMVTDAVFCPHGHRVACLGKENEKWHIVVDGQAWDGEYDMAWKPVFSPDSRAVAAKVEKNKRYTIVVDGKPLKEAFSAVWDPIFSPDGEKMLVRAIQTKENGGKYFREVISLKDI